MKTRESLLDDAASTESLPGRQLHPDFLSVFWLVHMQVRKMLGW
jgi:hypothetical protein